MSAFEASADILQRALDEHLWDVAEAVCRVGLSEEDCISLVQTANESGTSRRPIGALKNTISQMGADCANGAVEKLLLTRAALQSLATLSSAPVSEPVKQRLCGVFHDMARPAEAEQSKFTASHAHFGAMCKFATLRRFPAGEYDWDETGVPRSYFLRVDRRNILRLLHFVVTRLGGLGPVFYLHVGLYRSQGSFTREEHDRAYWRVAQALKLQPQIRGCMGAPWFCSPDVIPVSPHLAWIRENYLARGALVLRLGPPDPTSGALGKSETRRRAYKAGTYTPTKSVMLWPRDAIVAWADAHPELGEKAEDHSCNNKSALLTPNTHE